MELSSYNLDTFFTAVAILSSVFGLLSVGQLFLRIQLRMDWEIRVLLVFVVSSFFYVLISENINENLKSGLWGTFGAIYMGIAIFIYVYILLRPIKKINRRKIKILNQLFVSSILHDFKKTESLLAELPYFFNDLLKHSLVNETAENIIGRCLGSQIFIGEICKSGALTSQLMRFCEENYAQKRNKLYYATLLLERIVIESLKDDNSFLVKAINEDVFPNSLSFLDEFLFNKNARSLNFELLANCPYDASYAFKRNYMKMVKRYFDLLHQLSKYKDNKFEIDEEMVAIFFREISEFFDVHNKQGEKDKLLDDFSKIGNAYRNIENSSESLQKIIGEGFYNILEKFISFYEKKEDESLRLRLHFLYDDFIGNIGDRENIVLKNRLNELLKKKIIEVNSMGGFPALILIYFYLYGHHVFTDNIKDEDIWELHLPILQSIAKSFPRLHDGFVREFFNIESIPENRREELMNKGSEIIFEFLPENMDYDYEKNVLTYFYSGRSSWASIDLSKVLQDNKIEIIRN